MISGPRNVSTAMMYSFAQRNDTRVRDEPFYGVFLSKTGVLHPGREAVLAAMPHDERMVRASITTTRRKPVLFIKDMAHHLEVLEEPFIAGATPVFLIRDPARILRSYSAVMTRPVMRDIGIAFQYQLFTQLQKQGIHPAVVDSGSLLQSPEAVLRKLCALCGLAYQQRMAHWPSGPKPYDGVWAPYWYANVHRTTGFEPPPANSLPLPPTLQTLYQEAMAFYEKLLPFSIKA